MVEETFIVDPDVNGAEIRASEAVFTGGVEAWGRNWGEGSNWCEEVKSSPLWSEGGEKGDGWPRGGVVYWSEVGEVGRFSAISSMSKSVLEVRLPEIPSSESEVLIEGVKEELES